MTSIRFALLIAALIAVVVIFRKFQTSRLVSKRDQHLAKKQVEIQSTLDNLGAILKNESTTLEAGNAAAVSALDQLRSLNHDGSLGVLIADTELFVEEWRAARVPA